MSTKKKLLGVAGTLASIIGAITLPDDVGTWGNRIAYIWDMVKDNPISGFAIVVGLVLLAWANWDMISRVIGAKRWRSDVELGNEIHGWLRLAQYRLQELTMQDIRVPPDTNLAFGFVSTEPLSHRPVAILKIVGAPGILLQARVVPSDIQNHRQIIENMTDSQRADMFEDIGLEVARFGVGLAVGFATASLLAEGIVISHGVIPSDSMSQHQFMTHVGLVSRATLVVQLVISRHVRRANPAAPLA